MNENDKLIFEEELSFIDDEINKIDDLYKEVKDHYDEVRNSRTKGSLTFLEKQTSNLVQIKNTKINLLKEKINIKKIRLDNEYREKQLDIKKENNNAIDTISSEVLAKLSKEFSYIKDDKKEDVFTSIDDELDSMTDGIDISGIIADKVNNDEEAEIKDSIIEEESANRIIVYCEEDENFYYTDEEFSYLTEAPKDTDIIDHFEVHKDDKYAVGLSEKVYLVITIEEE